MRRLYVHLIVLPRWFALPAVGCAVALGCIQTGAAGWLVAMAVLSSAAVMAWGHSMNTLLDYLTGIDCKDDKTSRPKSYTSGNQVIVSGFMSPIEVLVNAICWLGISMMLISVTASHTTAWIYLPWGLSALMTFLYSWGKLRYLCELALGLGFGPLAVMMGAAASQNFAFADFGPAFLSGLVFAWVFGFGAEFIDQAFDADVNWDSGLRNMGALAWKTGIHPATFTCVLLAFAYIIQIALVIGGYLAPLTLSTLALMPPFVYCIMGVCEAKPDVRQAELRFNNKAIVAAMAVMFLWMLALVISQAVAT
ncbi:MAG: UbiA family prenyltransferase [Patescibacteria group bacterium]